MPDLHDVGFRTWILKDRIAYRCEDLRVWAEFMDDTKRAGIASTEVNDVMVSTIFTGIDYPHRDSEEIPLLFETVVFSLIRVPGANPLTILDEVVELRRYSTMAEAEIGHARMVAFMGGP